MTVRQAGRALLVVLAAVALLLGLAPVPAAAQTDEDTATEGVRGRLKYENLDGDDVPVAGVSISATDADGVTVATVETDGDGAFEIGLPGPGDYAIILDESTLPEGVNLRTGGNERSFSMSPGQFRSILFPLVEGEGGIAAQEKTRLERLPQLTFEGIKFGLIIAMSAVGLSLIFGTTGLVNFAHGELVTLGALIAYLVNVTMGVHIFLAAPIAVVASGALGGAFDIGFWRPLRARGTSLTAMLVVSIGVSLFVRYAYLYQFGGRTRPYDQFSIQTETLDVAGITFVRKDLWTIGVCILLLTLVAIGLQRTRIGKATRAVADNRDLAESSGIDVDRVIFVVWATGGALAAVGGIFLALSEQVSWQGGFQLLLLMFAGVTLGGLGTAYGALVGSLVVGLAVQLSTLVIAAELKNVAALVLLALVLLVRPQGILGQRERVG